MPDCRVLLLDSRRDGLSGRTEGAIAGNLSRAGVEIDLDAVSDPRSLLRVLDKHPRVLDGYDVVVAVAPHRADPGRSTEVLTRILGLLSARTPTLLVEHPARGTEWEESAGPHPSAGSGIDTLLLPLDLEPDGAAREISAALLVLLGPVLTEAASASSTPGAEVATLLRDAIGPATIERLERITQIARDSFGLAVAEVNLLHGEVVVTVASTGALPRSLPADDSLCVIALRNAGITVMPDTWLDPDACLRTPTHEPDAVRFYAACPIRSSTGEPMGMLCVWDFSPHHPGEMDFSLLNDLALLTEGELIHT